MLQHVVTHISACFNIFSTPKLIFSMLNLSATNKINMFCNDSLGSNISYKICTCLHNLCTYQISYTQVWSINIKWYFWTFVFSFIMHHVSRMEKKISNCRGNWHGKTKTVALSCYVTLRYILGVDCLDDTSRSVVFIVISLSAAQFSETLIWYNVFWFSLQVSSNDPSS